MVAKGRRKKTKDIDEKLNSQIWAVGLMSLAVFIFAGLNFTAKTGQLGVLFNFLLRTLLGDAALALPFLLAVMSLTYFLPVEVKHLKKRFIGLGIIFCLLAITLHLRLTLQELEGFTGREFYQSIFSLSLKRQGGGLLGGLLTIIFLFLFKDLGSYIVIVALGVVALLLLTNSSIMEILTAVIAALKWLSSFLFRLFDNLSNEDGKGKFKKQNYTINDYNSSFLENKKNDEEEQVNLVVFTDEKLPSTEAVRGEIRVETVNVEDNKSRKINGKYKNGNGEEDNTSLEQLLDQNTPYDDYVIPPVTLLTKVNKLRDHQQQKIIQERARALESTFASFGVKVKIKEVQAGPVVTRFEIQPETGVKVSKILSLSDDLALNLAAPDVRIEAPIPGKAAIGIEVPNKIISLVYLREVLEDPQFQDSPSPLTIGLGKDITGIPVFADLLKMPHLLIAGSTGSGKSVCINSIICSILLKATPWVVKFLLIDPKVVELSTYNGIPHLISPVITEPKKASVALRRMVREMERRYELFAREGVRDIHKYNEKILNNEIAEAENTLPFIVVLIDELADLMMVAPAEVEDSIVRLSQMSRAAGIHLVIATQRPSVDIITGLIKANITSRIAFAVSSQVDSRTILDVGGAEKLLGRGDMLYHPLGMHKPIRVQGAFVSESDIFKIVDFIKKQESPVYQQTFFEENSEKLSSQREEYDPLLPEVLELIVQAGHASISLIQRRFRVGYTRAARLIDELERLGVVSEYEGSKPRQVLISPEKAASLVKEKFDL